MIPNWILGEGKKDHERISLGQLGKTEYGFILDNRILLIIKPLECDQNYDLGRTMLKH